MPRILLIDDDEQLGPPLAAYFQRFELQLVHATRPSDGLVQLRRGGFDAAILDVMLPEMDGFELCRTIRRDSDLPIVMLTARGDVMDRVVGLELGADDYLAKPFSMLELVARIRALFRRIEQLSTPAAAPQELRFGPFRLDTVRRELLRGDERVPLTLREFDLLHFLLKHPGRPFSRGELLQRVWGDGFDGYEHTVNSHINRLRSRIEDDPREPRRVVTVWGVGYRFDPEPTTTRP